jgi:hypothetical protein
MYDKGIACRKVTTLQEDKAIGYSKVRYLQTDVVIGYKRSGTYNKIRS